MTQRLRAAAFGLALAAALGAAERVAADPWETTIRRAVPAVVALRVSGTRSFDTESASVTAATGFVVDVEQGLILTNRHVVRPGPVTAEAVFLNHETVPVQALYRDPVHDFGFFRFDPAAVRFMELGEIALAPERARVGTEIRIVGNDAGEKLSILAGTLARLDRDAPAYGPAAYNDFNTFYYQAASGTSGGSSGSPVIDLSGDAIALNAGGSRSASSSFFLPLDRVVRALHYLQDGRPVPRGTLQAVFRHRSFDELRRLGLRSETEAAVRRRAPGGTGLLVVEEVLPGGPAHGRLEPGDVLVALGGAPLDGFAQFEAALDDSVGRTVELELERRGERRRATLEVGDLHAITPHEYLEFGGGVLHALSFQQARNRAFPVRGVYVAAPGYALARADVPPGALLTALGGNPIADLDALEAQLAAQPDGARLPLRWVDLDRPRTPRVSVLPVDRRWFPMQRCTRDDRTGTWPCRASPAPPPAPAPTPVAASLDGAASRAERAIAPSLVFVEFEVPYKIDGAHGRAFSGTGLVVDAERGLVVVDRDTVPVSLGELRLTFGRSASVPGRLVALHPEHNLAVVAYDPALLAGTPVQSAELRPEPVEVGEALWLVGFDPAQRLVSRSTEVARVEEQPIALPDPPRFRESNVELVFATEATQTVGGVLADDRGRVRALWSSISRDERGGPNSFFAGLPVDLAVEMLEPLREGREFRWRSLGVELGAVSLADARERGLSPEGVERLASHDPARLRSLEVERVAAGAPAAALLQPGDLLLAADGAPVTSFREVERAAQRERVSLTVLRDGAELALEIETLPLDAIGTRRALLFAGALLQSPPFAASIQRGVPPEGVYVVGRWYGSPVDRYGLRATRRILAAGGTPTLDLDAFLRAVRDVPDRGSVQL
ncbi:MAG TPA: trypsin-like peptidase domain-containing protein, partial [Myxococcota bacterium]|nr:trypsin-like peptidase domain-containing protein [Myxococcota bacterium]